MVLNPNSGEWVKGLNITMAEMGLVSYRGKIPRTKEIFQGIGSKENRRKYLIHRLAFIRGYFELLGIQEVVLYRGMTGNEDWKTIHRSLLPCTFSLDVGKAFANFDDSGKFRIGYLLKMTCKIDKLFMTYLETENMNKQYKEAEAVLIYNDKITI